MSNTVDIKTEARQALRNAHTEEEAIKNLEALGLISPVVSFSEPNASGQMMKMGMAYHEQEIIHF